MAFQILLGLLLASPGAGAGEVKLPLRDYLALVEKAEAATRERADAASRTEADAAELVSQHVSVTLGDSGADVTTAYEAELRGRSPRPLALPLVGTAGRIVVEPPGPAAVRAVDAGLELVATAAGRYRVIVHGRASLGVENGMQRLPLPRVAAPVADAEISLPETSAWSCPGAVTVDESVRAGRRTVTLALPRGRDLAFEVQRTRKSSQAEAVVASAVVVTLVSLGVDGVRRDDVVLYEVARGELDALAITLPSGLEPVRAATDEGELPAILDGRALRATRTKRLTGTGYLAVTSEPAESAVLAIGDVGPAVKVRARYLVLSSSVAATVVPGPVDAWTAVDRSDLPPAIHDVLGDVGFVAAWRRKRDDAAASLSVARMPPPDVVDTEVARRESMTLLTVDGTLVHRDRFTLAKAGTTLEVKLPEGATVWSSEVGGVAVRPIERDGAVRIPLGLGARSGVVAEIVVVESRKVPPGRSRLDLALPEVAAPVLEHEWRVLLPEGNRYRVVAGDLRRARERPRRLAPMGRAAAAPPPSSSVVLGPSGSGAGIRGRVQDPSGGTLPGARVTLVSRATGERREATTDESGAFWFAGLPTGAYSLDADLAGFKTQHYESIPVVAGQTQSYAITLEVGALAETLTIQAAPAFLGDRDVAQKSDETEQANRDFKAHAAELQQGLVGGVKPVPVTIPEEGKALVLAGALPPPRVTLALEVKAGKKR